jgi:hypothetical protein
VGEIQDVKHIRHELGKTYPWGLEDPHVFFEGSLILLLSRFNFHALQKFRESKPTNRPFLYPTNAGNKRACEHPITPNPRG